MIWQISKEFDFCYGHRVWSQQLDSEFSLTGCLACRHLHGHQGKVIVYLQSSELKDGMVTDFHHLNWFKLFLDNTLDHKFIIDIHDPLFATLLP
ncbi:MAG: 6-carboxytetrahydropterin synthase, partial [Sulfurospirillum sp.]